jgi:type IV secretion system protein VirB10
MEESPSSLKPPKPGGKGMSKKPMVIALVVFLTMLLALMYSLSVQKKKTGHDEEKKPAVAAQPLAQGQGEAALALPPSAKTPAVAAVGQDETKPRKNLVVSINQPKTKDDPAEKRREQLYLTALSSPMLAKKSKDTGEQKKETPGRQSALLGSNITTSQPERETAYDPAANVDKENFFTRADTASEKNAGWLSRYTREAGRSLEVKTGTVIPAVMVTGINSDLPGVMVAQVSQNVYDTATGQHLLLPQGAKLYGMYDSRVIYGQERVLVAWNRVIFPDGSSVTLGAMPGADISGYAGFNDQVNNHYIRIFGSAFLMSIITGGVSYSVDSMSNNNSGNNNGNTTTFQDAMAAALAAQMGSVTLKLLEKNLNIAPTLEIRPGYQFNVICTKDVAFTEPYSDQFISASGASADASANISHGNAVRP